MIPIILLSFPALLGGLFLGSLFSKKPANTSNAVAKSANTSNAVAKSANSNNKKNNSKLS